MADQDGCEFESIEIGITEDDRDLRNVQERGAVDFISKKLLGFMFCLGLFWAGAALTLFFTKDFHENQCIFPLDLMSHVYSKSAVASDNKICSKIGVEIMKKYNGNAIDASISTALCLGVVNPFASGLGGGGFMLIHLANGSSEVIDFREFAPASANETMFFNRPHLSQHGGLSIAVPAELKGLWMAWKRHGQAKWEDIIAPAQKLAQDGFEVHPLLVHRLTTSEIGATVELANSSLARIFAPNGKYPKRGEILRRPELANFLQLISEKGVDAMYTSPVVDEIAKEIQDAGGIVTVEDLKAYEPIIRSPMRTKLGTLTILNTPAASGGPVLAFLLKIFNGWLQDMRSSAAAKLNEEKWNRRNGKYSGMEDTGLLTSELGPDAADLHLLIEAMKLGFGHRMQMGDPAFVDMESLFAKMEDDEYIQHLRLGILRDGVHESFWYQFNHSQFFQTDDHGTAHISVVDENGNAVSLTSTINLSFGSKILSNSTGIIFNDQMDDFSTPGHPNAFGLAPSEKNFIKPHKRPLSSMSPTILLDSNGNIFGAIGASGGPTIIASVFLVLAKLMAWSDNLAYRPSFVYPFMSSLSNLAQDTQKNAFGQDIAYKSKESESSGNHVFGDDPAHNINHFEDCEHWVDFVEGVNIFGLGPSIRDGRLFHQLFPNYVLYEVGFPQDVILGLNERGQSTMQLDNQIGCVNAVLKNFKKSIVVATSDWRKLGQPAGY